MNKKLLVASGEGIGNFIQITPTIRTIKEIMGCDVDYFHMFGSYGINRKICPFINKFYQPGEVNMIDPREYFGLASTFWTRSFFNVANLEKVADIHPLSMDEPEVDTYLKMASDLGISEKDFIYDTPCNYKERPEQFDVVIADGYNRHGSANWSIKSYPHYNQVVKRLNQHGYTVCSIGAPEEYISGTINMTGLPLLDSIGIINNSKVFLGNDSGMYHAAASLKKPSVVIFTATSVKKNSHPIFHDSVHLVMREDLRCRPCQKGQGWKKCKDWKCQQIQPEFIFNLIKDKLV